MDLQIELKGIRDEIVGRIETGDGKVSDLQKQVDAIDLSLKELRNGGGHRGFTGHESKSLGELFTESEEYKAANGNQFRKSEKITAIIENPLAGWSRKSTITNTSGLTQGVTGVTMPMRLPGVVGTAQQALRIRDLMQVRRMDTGNAFDYVRQITRTNSASPQVETSPKGESTYAWDTQSKVVTTVAHFCNVTRQALSDVPWLQGTINSELMYGLKLKEETEILSGDGLGAHMLGIIPQATAYASGTYNVSGDTKLDKLRHAMLQARLAGLGTFAPDAFVLHPTDIHAIDLLKDETGGANKGRYIIGDPINGATARVYWGLPVVESDSIVAGTFLVGAFGTAAEVINRMDATVELSFEHDLNFVKNICTILAELRSGIAVLRPTAFVTGSY